MADAKNSGKNGCPICGAKSNREDFGKENNRHIRLVAKDLCMDPETTKRRNRAAAMRQKNLG